MLDTSGGTLMGPDVHAEKTDNKEATRKMSLLHDRQWRIMFVSCFIWILPDLIVCLDDTAAVSMHGYIGTESNGNFICRDAPYCRVLLSL